MSEVTIPLEEYKKLIKAQASVEMIERFLESNNKNEDVLFYKKEIAILLPVK